VAVGSGASVPFCSFMEGTAAVIASGVGATQSPAAFCRVTGVRPRAVAVARSVST